MATSGDGHRATAVAEPTGDDAEQGQEEAGSTFKLGSYNSREEAEKGLREKDETINRLRSERDRAVNQQNEKLAAALEKLAEQQAAKGTKSGEDEAQRLQTLVDDLADAWQEDPKKGARETLRLMSAYVTDVEKSAGERVDKTTKSVRDELAQQVAELRALMADRDPEYVTLKEKVSELAEELGLDPKQHRDVLLKLARREAKTQHPARHELPGGLSGSTGRADDDGGASYSPAEWAMIQAAVGGRPLTEVEKKQLRGKA